MAAVFGIVATAVFMSSTTVAMDREELRNVPPHIRNWFESQRSPQGKLCCSYSDGHRTEYDMKENRFWVPINEVWTPVPPEAVIYDQGNPFSEAVVWYNPVYKDGKATGETNIICFVPGGGS